MAPRRIVIFFTLALSSAYGQVNVPAAGKLLIASRDLKDPNFAESVVLLVNYDEDSGALGLIVNRRSEVAVARVLRDLKAAKGRTEPIYLGGPVESAGVLAVLRASTAPEEAQRIFGDVYLVASKALLEKALTDGVDASQFHIFLGYTGWAPGQLEHEIEIGSWNVMAADTATVFSDEPEGIWPRLIRRTESRIASILAAGQFRR